LYSVYGVKLSIHNSYTYERIKEYRDPRDQLERGEISARQGLGALYPIRHTVSQNLPDLLELLVTSGSNVNVTPGLLLQAIRDGREKLAKILLEAGVDTNTGDQYFTPLEMAMVNGASGFVRLLLDYSADPNRHSPNRTGRLNQH
jgi:ankyrin repeat protein